MSTTSRVALDGRGGHHGLAVHEVLLVAGSDPERGLSPEEAADRLTRYGPNVAPAIRQRGPLVRFAMQFHNPLIYVLLAALAVTVAVGEYVDAAVIAGVVLVNAVLGFVQEQRATVALAALADLTRTSARVFEEFSEPTTRIRSACSDNCCTASWRLVVA